jgi:hypothetical protein
MPMVLRGIQEFKRSRLAFSAARPWILMTSTTTTINVAVGKRNSRGYFRSRHFLRAQPSKPTGSLRLSGIFQNLHSGLLKIDQRTFTHARAPDQLIPNTLAQFVAVFGCRNLLTDKIQRGRHIGNCGLIELGQHHWCLFSLRLQPDLDQSADGFGETGPRSTCCTKYANSWPMCEAERAADCRAQDKRNNSPESVNRPLTKPLQSDVQRNGTGVRACSCKKMPAA